MTIKPHFYPNAISRSSNFKVRAQRYPLDVLHHPGADHTSFECSGPVDIEIELPGPPGQIYIRPLARGIKARTEGNRIHFTLQAPQKLQVEIEGQPLLYIYALTPAPEIPDTPHVHRFSAGKIHDVGLLTLGKDEICWIEAGAVLRGSIRAERTSGVRIGGYGILDGSYWAQESNAKWRKSLVLDHCTDCQVEDILMLGPSSWMLVLGGCDQIDVKNIRQIAIEMSTDGIDIAGSRRVSISGCCLHNGDDNIAIKALRNLTGKDERVPLGFPTEDWKKNVEDIVVRDCIFYNVNGGSAMEIGYETSTDYIRNIRFENIDVLAVHQFGSVFGMHPGDRAHVENVTWDTIRVEHHYDKLVDFRVLKSRWNLDMERGQIRNVVLRNVAVLKSIYNEGYTVSIIAGYDAAHDVQGVRFENFVLGGKKVLSADDLDLVTRNVHDITFA
jgi:hypothetical protein